MSKLTAVPMELKQVQAYINEKHRHHRASFGDKFRIGVQDENGNLIGVVQCGRPLARHLDDGKTLEVLRLCTDGSKDVCSFLYSRCARIAKELGYEKIITYILETEPGTSLKASGWKCEDEKCGGGNVGKLYKDKAKTCPDNDVPRKEEIPRRCLETEMVKRLEIGG